MEAAHSPSSLSSSSWSNTPASDNNGFNHASIQDMYNEETPDWALEEAEYVSQLFSKQKSREEVSSSNSSFSIVPPSTTTDHLANGANEYVRQTAYYANTSNKLSSQTLSSFDIEELQYRTTYKLEMTAKASGILTFSNTGASNQWPAFSGNNPAINNLQARQFSRLAAQPLITPYQMVKQIHEFPPGANIANAFFKLCVVAARASSNKSAIMNYLEDERKMTLPQYFAAFQGYVMTHIAKLSLIGHLLVCGVPSWFCRPFVKDLRHKTGCRKCIWRKFEQV